MPGVTSGATMTRPDPWAAVTPFLSVAVAGREFITAFAGAGRRILCGHAGGV